MHSADLSKACVKDLTDESMLEFGALLSKNLNLSERIFSRTSSSFSFSQTIVKTTYGGVLVTTFFSFINLYFKWHMVSLHS